MTRRKNAKNSKRTSPTTDHNPLRQPTEPAHRGSTLPRSPSGGETETLRTTKRKFSLSQPELGLRIRNELKSISDGPFLGASVLGHPLKAAPLQAHLLTLRVKKVPRDPRLPTEKILET